MRGILSALAILAVAALAAFALHELDLAPAPLAGSREPLPIVDDVRNWRYRFVDQETGAVEWEMSGDRISPESAGRFEIDAPRIVHYGRAGEDAVTATALAATASLPKGAPAIIRFEKDIVAAQGAWTFRGEEIVFELPPREKGGGFDADRRARMTSTRRVSLESTDPPCAFAGTGLDAAAARREATLEPPVHAEIEAAVLSRAETGDGAPPQRSRQEQGKIVLDTDHPVVVRELRKGELEIAFTGPTRGVQVREGESEPYRGLVRGGKLRLIRDRREGERGKQGRGAGGEGGLLDRAPASGEFGGGVELWRGDALVARGERLLWDGAAAVATLAGTPARQAELFEPRDGLEVRAGEIRYFVRAAEAELAGAVRGAFPYAPRDRRQARTRAGPERQLAGTWTLDAPRAIVRFEKREGSAAPGEVVAVVATGPDADAVKITHAHEDAAGAAAVARYDVRGERLELEAAPGALARFWRGKSALAARRIAIDRKTGVARLEGDVGADLERELWAGEEEAGAGASAGGHAGAGTGASPDATPSPRPSAGAEEARRLAAADWHIEADLVTARFVPEGGTVTAVELEGRSRQALLRSRPRAPEDPVYEVRGSRIAADRAAGTIAVGPAPGESSRQTLVRGRDSLEAREIRYDEARGRASAAGEAIFVRALGGADDPGLRAEAASIELAFAPALAREKEKETLAAAPLSRRRPQTLTARGTAGRPVVVVRPDPDHPLRLEAPRIEGHFAAADGALVRVHVEGDGGPVTIAPANDLPPEERFRVIGGRIVYDLETATGEVFGLAGGPPEARRGPPGAEKEWLAAKRVTFDARAQALRLRDGVRGKFFAKVPAELANDSTAGRPPRPSLFTLEADEADISLARGVSEIEARGRVRFADAALDVRAERAVYDRAASTVRLEGRPVEIVRGERQAAAPRTLTVRVAPPQQDQEK